ncbi:hypothetical protein HN51_043572, partial [Arachis hypogaea]
MGLATVVEPPPSSHRSSCRELRTPHSHRRELRTPHSHRRPFAVSYSPYCNLH